MSETTPNAALEQLWDSLCRTGGHWGRDVLLTEEGDKFEAHLYLEDVLPQGSASHIQSYVKAFMTAQGWKVKTQLTRYYLRLELSKA